MAKKQEETIFRLGDDYVLDGMLGKGAYGVVCSAVYRPLNIKVAIKKIAPLDHAMFAVRTLREIKILRYFRHDNIVGILDLIKPSSFDDFNEVYLIQELMDTDLHRVICSQDLSDDHCQYFTYQILRALKCLHSAKIIHRDLKPSNILLNSNCDLKICDFGLARILNHDEGTMRPGFMTEYVATRWYRAPEIMLTFKEYTLAIDVWSVGCILSEMITGKALFPGVDYHHQLSLILEVVGSPTPEDYACIKSVRAREYIRNLPSRQGKSLAQIHPKAQPLALDLLENLLAFNPQKRLTVEQALRHPYLQSYHDPEDEPTAPAIPSSLFEFERWKDPLTKEELKVLLYNEINTPKLYYKNLYDKAVLDAEKRQKGNNSNYNVVNSSAGVVETGGLSRASYEAILGKPVAANSVKKNDTSAYTSNSYNNNNNNNSNNNNDNNSNNNRTLDNSGVACKGNGNESSIHQTAHLQQKYTNTCDLSSNAARAQLARTNAALAAATDNSSKPVLKHVPAQSVHPDHAEQSQNRLPHHKE